MNKIQEILRKWLNSPITIYSLRSIIAIVFLLSATAKVVAISNFEIMILQQHIVDDRMLAAYLARALIWFEFFIGFSFFQPYYFKRFFLPVSALLTMGFTGYLIYLGWVVDYQGNCGCFGDLVKMTPAESIVKNLVILLFMGILWKLHKSDPLIQNVLVPGIIGVSILAIIFILFPIKIIGKSDIIPSTSGSTSATIPDTAAPQKSPVASRFKQFNTTDGPFGPVDLISGSCLVAMLSLDCDHCRDVARKLGEFHQTNPIPIFFIFMGEETQVGQFSQETGTRFPYKVVPPEIFFDFIGNAPPRVYWLMSGQINAFWDEEEFSNRALKQKLNPLPLEHEQQQP